MNTITTSLYPQPQHSTQWWAWCDAFGVNVELDEEACPRIKPSVATTAVTIKPSVATMAVSVEPSARRCHGHLHSQGLTSLQHALSVVLMVARSDLVDPIMGLLDETIVPAAGGRTTEREKAGPGTRYRLSSMREVCDGAATPKKTTKVTTSSRKPFAFVAMAVSIKPSVVAFALSAPLPHLL
jgi:hypothetical protein